ncbi:MAG TPA: hypothetical protein VJ719_13725 [Chthoniobacterales bacterium]|nr:hypothetical protein [Chthoniobacterales bacterium]
MPALQIAIEKLVAIGFLIIGISHLVQPRAWSEFFIRMREKGRVGSLQLGMLNLPLGLLIVAFHNIWHGLPMIVTIMGWALLLKSTLYLVWPSHGLRMLGMVSVEKSWRFIAGGVFSIAVSALIFWCIWRSA